MLGPTFSRRNSWGEHLRDRRQPPGREASGWGKKIGTSPRRSGLSRRGPGRLPGPGKIEPRPRRLQPGIHLMSGLQGGILQADGLWVLPPLPSCGSPDLRRFARILRHWTSQAGTPGDGTSRASRRRTTFSFDVYEVTTDISRVGECLKTSAGLPAISVGMNVVVVKETSSTSTSRTQTMPAMSSHGECEWGPKGNWQSPGIENIIGGTGNNNVTLHGDARLKGVLSASGKSH